MVDMVKSQTSRFSAEYHSGASFTFATVLTLLKGASRASFQPTIGFIWVVKQVSKLWDCLNMISQNKEGS